MKNLSIIILTKNEEKQIASAIKSVSFGKEIIIVDDYSTDKTNIIAKKNNAKIHKHHLKQNFAEQRNFGMKKAKYNWVLFLDSDERISKELKEKIIRINDNSDCSAYLFKRIDLFWNKKMHFGETRNIFVPRLVNKNQGKFVRDVHEVWQTKKKVKKIHEPLYHYSHTSLSEFIKKINFYSSINAKVLYKKGQNTQVLDILFTPLLKFFYLYFLKLGFFDGIQGLVYSIMMSLHSFLSRAKLYFLLNND